MKIIIGLLIILFSLTLIEPPAKKINETIIGDYVSITGKAVSVFNPEHLTIINLTDETGSIKTIIFDEKTINKNSNITIIGRITEYQGELELTGVKILKNP